MPSPSRWATGLLSAGAVLRLPFTVQRQPGASAAPTTDPTVEASFDDGATWQAARTVRRGDAGASLLRRPAGRGIVSLRVKAADAGGNTVELELPPAYRY